MVLWCEQVGACDRVVDLGWRHGFLAREQRKIQYEWLVVLTCAHDALAEFESQEVLGLCGVEAQGACCCRRIRCVREGEDDGRVRVCADCLICMREMGGCDGKCGAEFPQ